MKRYQEVAQLLDANAITNVVDAYEKGRADKYQEITSGYMLLTEKQVAEIRADAIEPIKAIIQESEKMMWHSSKTLKKIQEQLKEQTE